MLYKGSFNISGEIHKLYTQANNKEDAFHNFMHQLAKKLKIRVCAIRQIFNGDKDNYKIEKVD
jgi:hypothetical protein